MGVYLGKIPIGVVVSASKGYLKFCNVEQIITGDLCEIRITEGDSTSDYVIGWTEDNRDLSLYIVEK
jgi:hypothetical protein